ncbi:MAG: hypothetical protein CM1200mP37_2020 [Chloroflexota bacterium]|nr:MAG: hypothetical protein CM1200mP37_2020 [Chloroflexota bacterium]
MQLLQEFFFAGLAAIGIVATGMNAATIEVAATSVESAAIMDLVGNGMFSGLFFYWAIGNILIGSTILIQKRFHIAVGWLFFCSWYINDFWFSC